MDKVKTDEFEQLFSQYCREQVNEGQCTDGDCQWCSVNKAYEKIFEGKEKEEEEE